MLRQMPKLRPLPRAGLLAALLTLAACDQGPATVSHYRHTAGTFDFLISATRNNGPLLLQVEGRPFAGGAPVARMTGVLQQALQSRELRLTSDPGAAEDPRFRLVIVFSPAPGEVLEFCERTPAGGDPRPEGRVELRAGFCRDGKALAVIDGWAEEVEGPQDEVFAQLLRQVSRDVFSREGGDD
jgi:hypothetical protein